MNRDYRPQPPENPDETPQVRTMWAGDVILVVVVALVVAAVLNADSLLRRAEQKPFGDDRDFWVGVWEPVQDISDALLLNLPRKGLDEILDRDRTGVRDRLQGAVLRGTEGTPPPIPGAAAEPGATVAPEATPRVPSAANPLRLWAGGDSLAANISVALARMASDSGYMSTRTASRVATGLARPDYFDWQGEFVSLTQDAGAPEVFIVMLGGNDDQGLLLPLGDAVEFQTEAWATEYASRVGLLMDTLLASSKLVVWIGLPPMRDETFSESVGYIDQIQRAEAAKRPEVIYVDLWEMFGGGSGEYTPYFTGPSGSEELMREPDGMHLTLAGGQLVAEYIYAQILAEFPPDTATPGAGETPAATATPDP